MPGFLPFNATFMLDFVLISLVLVVPILIFGLIQVHKKNYKLHAQTMLALGLLVLVVVIAFEVDMRYSGGIEAILTTSGRQLAYTPAFKTLLGIHLFFAISTCILWVFTTIDAIKKFGLKNPQPGQYSKKHKLLGKITTLDIVGVAITGFAVYYMGFIKAIT
jgi:uncharacterized membrane protein YozB (DUF420 family)